jgi:hypothetical protein
MMTFIKKKNPDELLKQGKNCSKEAMKHLSLIKNRKKKLHSLASLLHHFIALTLYKPVLIPKYNNSVKFSDHVCVSKDDNAT